MAKEAHHSRITTSYSLIGREISLRNTTSKLQIERYTGPSDCRGGGGSRWFVRSYFVYEKTLVESHSDANPVLFRGTLPQDPKKFDVVCSSISSNLQFTIVRLFSVHCFACFVSFTTNKPHPSQQKLKLSQHICPPWHLHPLSSDFISIKSLSSLRSCCVKVECGRSGGFVRMNRAWLDFVKIVIKRMMRIGRIALRLVAWNDIMSNGCLDGQFDIWKWRYCVVGSLVYSVQSEACWVFLAMIKRSLGWRI